MQREQPSIPFERYADDMICHCRSEKQANWLRTAIERRLAECGLELHPSKTKIVYCKDDNRRGSYLNEKFDFLGYTYRPRRSKNRCGEFFVGFIPAASDEAQKSMRQTMRSWRLHRRSGQTLDDIARMINPILQGWINYYGRFYKSALYPTFLHLDRILSRWAKRKYKRLKGRQRKARHWLRRIMDRQPGLFAHRRSLYSWAGQ
jgi:RNA-directed DNA polymerase